MPKTPGSELGDYGDVENSSEVGRARRRSRGSLLIAAAACALLLAAVIPSPYTIERPGPVVNTLGDVQIEGETKPVISIPDAETFPTDGALNLLTVSLVGSPERPASWLSLVPALFDPSQRIAPRTDFYPEGSSLKDREAQGTVQMQSSQAQAAAAAFRQLGEPVTAELAIAAVTADGPADGVLREGDVLQRVNGEPIADFAELRAAIVESGAEHELRITALRDDAEVNLTLRPAVPEGGKDPLIGAIITTYYELPAEVDISLSEIGGPSAGMMFALGIIDQLTPGAMLDGKAVSGTGTVSDTGAIGAIGGLEQKIWAAKRAESDLFLMPLDNCGDLPARLPGGLTVAPVATLSEAVAAIEDTVAGKEVAGVERCSVADQ
ncbi:PDZ domain-containing protein [Leucobacter luti]|uniref:YlbL family protein n=1 Tax=Leucobacter luti TaxID=340320 RepID=UPI0010451BDE|nr:S16 family serine protease [Leucobacter luti]MCW2287480.1 PDZ domain-containing protein [Leucobacter luti]TCK41702.1 PDZ domain-containing protein [Leucobacter luti]